MSKLDEIRTRVNGLLTNGMGFDTCAKLLEVSPEKMDQFLNGSKFLEKQSDRILKLLPRLEAEFRLGKRTTRCPECGSSQCYTEPKIRRWRDGEWGWFLPYTCRGDCLKEAKANGKKSLREVRFFAPVPKI